MVIAERTFVDQFEKEGYVVLRGLLDPELDIAPVHDEYVELLDRLAVQWKKSGMIPDPYDGMPFGEKLTRIAFDTKGKYYQYLDISLPIKGFPLDTPMHYGPAVFHLLTSPRLLDAVERIVGPEIYSNPVQHVRIKPPERFLPSEVMNSSAIARTSWHQDLGVISSEADASEILTVWLPILDATVENGCLEVVPGSHRTGLALHCDTGNTGIEIPEKHLGPDRVALPMKPGDVLFMHKLTMHHSLPNLSDTVRWSFDLRYNPIGHPTGRHWFPGFAARSSANPGSVLRDPVEWSRLWDAARVKLADRDAPAFRRWHPGDPRCA